MAAPYRPDGPKKGRATRESQIAKANEAKAQIISPVTPLGTRDGHYFFTTPKGNLVSLSFRDLGSLAGLLHLLSGDAEWLRSHFGSGDNKRHGIDVPAAGAFFMRLCYAAGAFDDASPPRGIGVWPTPSGAAINCGDAVWIDGRWHPPGPAAAGQHYERRPAIIRPEDTPAMAEDGQHLCRLLGLWNWADAAAPEVATGFLGQGFLLGLLDWRAHLYLSGARGCGKSCLVEFASDVLGPLALFTNDFTSAGIRQALQYDARATLIDEAEATAAHNRMGTVVELIRYTSGGAGARSLRGTAGGSARRSETVSAFMLAGIVMPDLAPQDVSRITCLELKPLAQNASFLDVAAAREWARKTMPALWTRMIHARSRIAENRRVWRSALLEDGCDHREAEQWSTLLGHYWAMVDDDPATDRVASAELPRYRALIAAGRDTGENSGPYRCLGHLLSVMTEAAGGERPTIGALVEKVMADFSDDGVAAAKLRAYGIAVQQDKGGILVAHRNPNLARLFHNTPWANFGWSAELKRLPDAHAMERPTHFLGVPSRCTFIPKSAFSSDPR